MRWPAEAVPDGVVLAPHHLYIGLSMALFGFMFVWRLYPRAGATLTLLGVLVAADDAVSHAFGVWTPLDALWRVYLRGWMA